MVHERSQLPIADSHDEILDAIQQNQVVLIRGETGSGKTTQVSAVWFSVMGLATYQIDSVCNFAAFGNLSWTDLFINYYYYC